MSFSTNLSYKEYDAEHAVMAHLYIPLKYIKTNPIGGRGNIEGANPYPSFASGGGERRWDRSGGEREGEGSMCWLQKYSYIVLAHGGFEIE